MTLDGDIVTVGRTITLAQRKKAGDLLEQREPHLTVMQRVAIVDAMAYWLGETGDDELAQALAEVCCDLETARSLTAVFGPSTYGESRMLSQNIDQ